MRKHTYTEINYTLSGAAASVYIYTYTYVYIYTHVYVCLYMYIHISIHVYVFIQKLHVTIKAKVCCTWNTHKSAPHFRSVYNLYTLNRALWGGFD